jgi:hypothetical protein
MDAISTAPVVSMKWYAVWREVFLHPSANTFERILADPAASPGRAYAWVVITSALTAILGQIFNPDPTNRRLLICAILSPLFSLGYLEIDAQILHWVAKHYHGQGSYNRMVYVLGAIMAPFSIINFGLNMALSSLTHISSLFMFLFAVWMISIQVEAIKAAERITTGQACWTLILPGLVLIVVAVFVMIALAFLGSALGAGIR